MTELTKALDALMANAFNIVESISENNGRFTFEKFLYTLMHENQKAYIELLYLCRDHKHPFTSAHSQIGNRLTAMLGDSYSNDTVEGMTSNIFHNQTKNYVYKKHK